MQALQESSDILTTEEAAAYLRVSPRTIEMWRYRRRGPRFIKLNGHTVRYRKADLDIWLKAAEMER